MLALVIKNFILAVLIALILHFLIKNHMIEIDHLKNINKKENFVTNLNDKKGILKKNDSSIKSAIQPKSVKFDKNIESFNNFDLGSVYNKPDIKPDVDFKENLNNNKKIKDDLYEFVFNKQTEFGDSSIDSFSIQGGNNIINDDVIDRTGGNSIALEKESIKEYNDSFIDKKSDEMFDGIIGYKDSGNFSVL